LPEDILRNILMQRKDLSRDIIASLIEQKKAESGGFLSDEGAAILVAQDLNVQIGSAEPAPIQIKNLVSGLGNVTVKGQIKEISSVQEFERQNKKPGKVRRFLLFDETGEIRSVAWNGQAEKLSDDQIKTRTVLVSHAYTREGLEGGIELHIGDKGEIRVTESTLGTPEQSSTQLVTISEASRREGIVDLVGIVKTPPRVTEFGKADQPSKVLRMRLIDGTGRMTLVAWNQRAEDLHGVSAGKAIHVSGGRVKVSINGTPEIHIDALSRVEVLQHLPAHLTSVHSKPIKITEIKANMRDVDVLAKILRTQPPVAIKRPNGAMTKVMRLLLADETGIIQASLWDDKAELDLNVGEVVLIEDATSRERLGEVSINMGKTSAVSRYPKHQTEKFEPTPKRIADLPPSGIFIVEGKLTTQPSLRQVQTARGDTVDLAEANLRDGSSECRIVFWRDLARQMAALKQGTDVKFFGVHPRTGFKGGIELSSGPSTYFEVMSEPPAQTPPPLGIRKIAELKEGIEGTIQATILELSSNSHASAICDKCGVTIGFVRDSAICEKCSSSEHIDMCATLYLRADDGSGYVDSVVESPESNVILGQDSKWILRNIVEKKTPRVQLTIETLSRLIGMRISADGVLTKNPENGGTVFRIKKVHSIVP